MIKAILIVWIGWGNAQIMTTEKFDSIDECRAAAISMKEKIDRDGWYECVEYRF